MNQHDVIWTRTRKISQSNAQPSLRVDVVATLISIAFVSSSRKEAFLETRFKNSVERIKTRSGHAVSSSEVTVIQLTSNLLLERLSILLYLFAFWFLLSQSESQ